MSTDMKFSSAKLLRTDEVSASLTYLGYAVPGTLDSDAAWRIVRVSTSGTVTAMEYVNGTNNFNSVWANRAALSYS